MSNIPRTYDALLAWHHRHRRQMAFVSGPRQVGKTTSCRTAASELRYLSWDDQDDRRIITRGPKAVVEALSLERLAADRPTAVFDELHKYARWRTFLKGLFDKYGEQLHITVTGSSRMDLARRGGDSLMGRYLPYRMHPLSLGELSEASIPAAEIGAPRRPHADQLEALWTHGGFPEPLLKAEARFTRRWRRLRLEQLTREDIRDLTQIHELGQLSVLVAILDERSGSQLSYSSLAREVNVAVDTARRWVAALVALHHGFLVRPWARQVNRSLRKEPKWFLRDWSGVDDPGQRAETFVACHLLKAVQLWEDLGLGDYELRYLRDKAKREVDFVVIRNQSPWFLVEVKHADTKLTGTLAHFQRQLGAPHAFQAVMTLPWIDANCFDRSDPCVVPVTTLLSQLP